MAANPNGHDPTQENNNLPDPSLIARPVLRDGGSGASVSVPAAPVNGSVGAGSAPTSGAGSVSGSVGVGRVPVTNPAAGGLNPTSPWTLIPPVPNGVGGIDATSHNDPNNAGSRPGSASTNTPVLPLVPTEFNYGSGPGSGSTPSKPPQTPIVGDPNRIDNVIRQQAGNATKPKPPSNKPRLEPLQKPTSLPTSTPRNTPTTVTPVQPRNPSLGDFANGSRTPQPPTRDERRTSKPGDIRRERGTPLRESNPGFDIRSNPGTRSSAQPARGSQNSMPRSNPTSSNSRANADAANAAKRKKEVERKYVGRDISTLTAAEKDEIRRGGYTISKDSKGNPTIRRTNSSSGELGLHLEQNTETGSWTIEKGPAPEQSRYPSNNSTMVRNFKDKYKADVPKGHSLHHLIPVNRWKNLKLTQLAQKYGVGGGVDAADGLVAAPSNATAASDNSGDIPKLEKSGALVKILHPSSHDKWDNHVQELIETKERALIKKYRKKYNAEKLEDIPPDILKIELQQNIEEIRKELRKELQNASENIKKGRYDLLPDWAKDGRISVQPESSERQAQQPNSSFRQAAKNLIDRYKSGVNYASEHTYTASMLKQGTGKNESDTVRNQATTILALSPAIKNGFLQVGSLEMYKSKDDTIDVFNGQNGSRIASITSLNTSDPTIAMFRALSQDEIADAALIQKSMQAQQSNATKQTQLG
jgi:hypothetical protein